MKVLVIGIVASGKTTLCKRLSKELDIPCYEIDLIVHDEAKGIKRSIDEQRAIIDKINEKDEWLIEGVLRKHMDYLLEYSDIIIYIDIPLWIRKYRIVKRYIKQKIRIEECSYKPSIEMVKNMFRWTKEFEDNREVFMDRLSNYRDKTIVLDSVYKVRKFSLDK